MASPAPVPASSVSAEDLITRELDRVRTLRTTLVLNHPFFATLLLPMRIRTSSTLLTFAATNGIDTIWINPMWTAPLTLKQLGYVLLHEIGHCALLHALRKGHRRHELWNDACFPPGTFILGPNQPIEHVGIHADIYQDGGTGTVTATTTRHFSGQLLQLKASSLLPFNLTPQHPVLVRRKRRLRPIALHEPEWLPAKDVKIGDYLIIPRLRGSIYLTSIPLSDFYRTPYNDSAGRHITQPNRLVKPLRNGFPLTLDTAWVMGMYVAEGSRMRKDYGVQFSLGLHERALATKITAILTTLGYHARISEDDHALRVSIGSTVLNRAFAAWFGTNAKRKQIPAFIMFHEDLTLVQAFIQGFADGDGCYCKPKQTTLLATASHQLALQLQLALARLGILPWIHIYRKGPRIIRSRTLPPQTLYMITWQPIHTTRKILNPHYGQPITSTNRRWKLFDDSIAVPITTITTQEYAGPVYNLTTSSHTYLVSNAIVHNCDLATNALADDVTGHDNRPLYNRPDGVKVPGYGTIALLHAEWAKDLSAEQVYERLLQDPPPDSGTTAPSNGQPAASSAPSSGDPGNDASIPDEPNWSQVPCRPGTTCAFIPPAMLSQDDADRLTDRLIAAHEAWIASSQRGTIPGGLLRFIERLRRAVVPWQRILHQYASSALMRDDYSLSPPHRRWLVEADLVRPSLRSEGIGSLIVMIDTSGSITKRQLADFAAEVAKLATLSEETLLLTHDATVQQVIPTTQVPAFLRTLDFKGGGGTSHVPVFDWIAQHNHRPDLVIALTDLASDFPDKTPGYPVLWCATQDHATPPPWGRTVVIPDDDTTTRTTRS